MTSHGPDESWSHLPAPSRGAEDEPAHVVVAPVRDVTRQATERRPGQRAARAESSGRVISPASTGIDTGLRAVFPVTYDVVLDQPEGLHLGEDETPGGKP